MRPQPVPQPAPHRHPRRHYPKSQAEDPKCPLGCRLHDVINSNAKFTDIFSPAKPTGFT